MVINVKACSNRTTVYGRDNTVGALDFANLSNIELPNSALSLHVPMSRSMALPETSVDKNGIAPDVRIELPLPARLTDNIDEWTIWVAEQLEQFAAQQEKRPAPEEAEQRDVYACFAPKRFFIAVFRRGKLQYAASQDASNDNDRTFLLLGIWKALALHPQKDALHLEGATKDLKKTLAEYILNLED